MQTLTTKGIKISVESQFEKGHSNPSLHKFVHSYHVTIENRSSSTVQLLRRHWIILDSNCSAREVEGEGVIGQQPVLEPGSIHSYSSWCPLASEIGKMSGTYLMQRADDDSTFYVQIPEFKLVANFKLN